MGCDWADADCYDRINRTIDQGEEKRRIHQRDEAEALGGTRE